MKKNKLRRDAAKAVNVKIAKNKIKLKKVKMIQILNNNYQESPMRMSSLHISIQICQVTGH